VALATFVKLQLLASAAVKVDPNSNALPGMPAAEKLVDGLAAFILLGCAAGALLGIGQWVLGSRTNNYSQADSGRSKVAIAAGGAFLVGALAAIINFFVTAGGAVK
jgi:hypothetical protein